MRLNFTSIILLLLTLNASGQMAQRSCGTKKAMSRLLMSEQQKQWAINAEKGIQDYLSTHQQKISGSGPTTIYNIPVVVHVMHTGGAIGSIYNPSDASIITMINSLNDIYANLFDPANVSGTFNSVDIPIRFTLAQRDPNCGGTNGISRVDLSGNATYVADGATPIPGSAPGVDDDIIKNLDLWPTSDYYNIWIVNKIEGSDGTSGAFTAGYAQLPGTYITKIDGTILLATQVLPNSVTLAHELGHAFSLQHPFEGGDNVNCPANGDCIMDNDKVCDTDPILESFACLNTGTNPCNGTSWASSTTQYNYMAYNSCQDRFTPGQASRVVASLITQRASLARSLATDAPAAQSVIPANCNPTNANPTNNFAMGPVNVNFNEIEYNSIYYTTLPQFTSGVIDDRTCNQQTTLYKSVGTYPLTVKTISNPQRVKAYIDYNNDGIFNATTELVANVSGGAGDITHTANVVLPATGITFNTPLRMRVIADFTNNSGFTSCSALLYGQAEDFTVIIAQAPLATALNNIAASTNQSNNTVKLNWATALLTNELLFDVEHSTNAIDFVKVGIVNGNKGENNFSYNHTTPIIGNNYYRLKMISNNGSFTYSKVVDATIAQKESFTFNVTPNPANSQIHINASGFNIDNTQMDLIILDITGKVIDRSNVKLDATNTVDYKYAIEHLPNGLYFIQAVIGDQKTITKLVKQ
jgi:hypothetical protein